MCTEHRNWHHDYVRLAWDSGFSFDCRRSKDKLDWSSVGIVDIEQILKDRDVAIVEKHLSTVTNYYLEEEHSKILDPTFVKIFRLSQLSVQYLQFCKRYLDNTVVVLKKELAKYREENNHLRDYTEELKLEIVELKKKVKGLKDSLQNQPFSFENTNAHKCPTCLKMFLTEEYLFAHIKRRHENMTSFQSETDKLQLEIKELKERLNTTEKFIQSDHSLKNETVDSNKQIIDEKEFRVDTLIQKFDDLKQYIERELSTLKHDKCNDKYERWLEIVFKRLDNTKRELQTEKYREVDVLSTGDGYCEIKKADNVTQTGIVVCKDSEVMTEIIGDVEVRSKSPNLEVDIKKLQEDIYANTENQLEQMQDVLEQKLTGGLEQIQTQLSTFCQKLNTIETERALFIAPKKYSSPQQEPFCVTGKQDSSDSILTAKNFKNDESQPKPAPRTAKSLPLVKEKKLVARRSAPKLESKPFVKSPVQAVSSDVCSYSSMSEDEKVLFPPILSKLDDSKLTAKANNDDKPKTIEVETLYDKNIANTAIMEDTESSQSDDDENIPVKAPVKPSTSTLGRRSISSLKRAGKDKQVLMGLKHEVEEMLYLRLKEVGVSPAWKRLPQKSYDKAMSIIQHKSELFMRKHPDYWKIKDKLSKKVNSTLKKNFKKLTSPVLPQPAGKKHKSHMLMRRSKPPSEKKIIKLEYDSDDNSASNVSYYVTATKGTQEDISIETKPSTVPSKKKVFFDLKESTTVSKNRVEMEETYNKNMKQGKVPMLTMVISKSKAENALIDTIDLFGTARQLSTKESEDTTESITSSILDSTKVGSSQKKEDVIVPKEEISDWEISDIY